MPSEKTSITTRVVIIDNTKLAIQVGGHTSRVVLVDTSAQLVIIGVQFANKMSIFNPKLRISMWQIHIASGNVEEVLGKSLDLISLNFNERTN